MKELNATTSFGPVGIRINILKVASSVEKILDKEPPVLSLVCSVVPVLKIIVSCVLLVSQGVKKAVLEPG
jgi:hypothetical protein